MALKNVLVIFMFMYSTCHGVEVDLTVELDPGARECFHQYIPNDMTFDLEYQVIEGGEMDINFVVQSPLGHMMLTDIRKSSGVHSLDTKEEGDYMFCIDNTFSRFSRKVVFFEILTDEEEDEDLFGELEEDDMSYFEIKVEDIKSTLDTIKQKLDKSTQTQNILRVLESRDRSIQEDNFMRVNFWSGVQLFVMVSVSVAHVIMIRSLFGDGKKSGSTKMRT